MFIPTALIFHLDGVWWPSWRWFWAQIHFVYILISTIYHWLGVYVFLFNFLHLWKTKITISLNHEFECYALCIPCQKNREYTSVGIKHHQYQIANDNNPHSLAYSNYTLRNNTHMSGTWWCSSELQNILIEWTPMWWSIFCVNLTAPQVAQTKHYFWLCLWGCFETRLTFKLAD